MLLTVNCIDFQNSYAAEPNVTGNEKVIYLTFDDGPSPLTNKVLDILKEKDVKATFFLIGNQIRENESTVKRIYDEGNGIGLHTYTHKNRKIYSSQDAFIKEMDNTREEINRVVGVKPNIIRFPEGSRKRLNKNMLQKLHGYNYRVYDWNIVTSDGLNAKTPPEKLFRQATKSKNKPNPVILLMHCDYMHKNTCKALPRIINYYKQEGYEFKIITNNTPELYFPISKK
ncbi:polysaccharide deacetylase family protein [Clostridium sp. Mt-5]|uniref:Polysaccharide deacetylase family protein n=1 Tax=Clostridium moutaii TaxID=3240932 RepID=A0ABV4BSP9_9CLOT